VLDLTAGGGGQLGYRASDGIYIISTLEDLDGRRASSITVGDIHDALTSPRPAPGASAVPSPEAVEAQVLTQMISQLALQRLSVQQERDALSSAERPPAADMLKALNSKMARIDEQQATAKHQLAKLYEDAEDKSKSQQSRTEQVRADRAARRQTKTYDALELLGAMDAKSSTLNAEQRAAMEDLIRALKNFANADETVSGFNGMIIVEGTPETHDRIAKTLVELSKRQQEVERNRRGRTPSESAPPTVLVPSPNSIRTFAPATPANR
jgi:hypothetical protein